MSDEDSPKITPKVNPAKPEKPELKEEDLDKVTGGLNPQPLPPMPPVSKRP